MIEDHEITGMPGGRAIEQRAEADSLVTYALEKHPSLSRLEFPVLDFRS
ncbi:hypothetical protein OOK31_25830 [Streptomyces sp. NBC_00249]|nr:hypothetical protein [Streptomyces sp. NBC_00249]MCX5197278.1 hypothetical protein [Streptomyces sp. NBC_00249]